MSLLEDIRKDMFSASKQSNTVESDILKMVIAVIKNEEISKGEKLTEEEILKVLRKESKKVQDSINEFTKMGRDDLIAKEKVQLEVLERYLPAMLDESKVREVVKEVISKSGAQDMKDMGRVMGMAMKELNGQADGNTVRDIVSELLS
jgi:uncharacterized protein YqeY